MKTIRDISGALRASAVRSGVRQADLKTQAGVSQRTLTNVLSGTEDFKVSTLLALADRLGLELVLVPKAAASAVGAGATTEPRVKSRVSAALDRVRAGASAGKRDGSQDNSGRPSMGPTEVKRAKDER